MASDCRSLEQIPEDDTITYIGQKYTWIKTNPSFEGLMQIYYDSDGRIEYQENYPIKKDKQYFSSISLGNNTLFENGNVKFLNDEIDLNSDMIALIGSRGSGKSLLLDVFARLHGKLSKYNEKVQQINLKSDFRIEYKKEENSSIVSNIENINELDYVHVHQSELNNICEDPIDMNREIRKLLRIPVFEHLPEIDEKMDEIIDNYFDIMNWSEEQDENGNFIHHEDFNRSQIEKYNNKIKFIKTTESQEQIEKLRECERKLYEFNMALSEIHNVKEKLEKTNVKINKKIKQINKIADVKYHIPLINFEQQLNAINEIIPYFQKEQIKLNSETNEIKEYFKEKGIDDVDFIVDQVKIYEGYINRHKSLLEQIKNKKNDLDQITPSLIKISNGLKQNIDTYFDTINSKWKDINDQKLSNEEQNRIRSELLESIEIRPEIYFDVKEFYGVISQYLNKTKFRQRGSEIPLERMKNTINVYGYESYISLIQNEPIIIVENYDKELCLTDFLEEKEFFNVDSDRKFFNSLYKSQFIQRFCQVISTTRFKGREIGILSMGERGTLFLRLKLATAAFSLPFIFDQPEDELDNDFIQNYLVRLFRQIKKYRQIIVATHNANVVVNSNAEQIIIAKNENEELIYISGGLEEPLIRQEICEILEGGKEAFRRRAMKYGLMDQIS